MSVDYTTCEHHAVGNDQGTLVSPAYHKSIYACTNLFAARFQFVYPWRDL